MIRKSQQQEILENLKTYKALLDIQDSGEKIYQRKIASVARSIEAMEHIFDEDPFIYVECKVKDERLYDLLDLEFEQTCKMEKLENGLYKGEGSDVYNKSFYSIQRLIKNTNFLNNVSYFTRMVSGEEEDLMALIRNNKMPPLTEEEKKELANLNNLSDQDIDFSDIPEITEEQWKKAHLFYPKPK